MIEELGLEAQLVGLALLRTEGRFVDVRDRVRQTRGPTTRLETFRIAHVEHGVRVEMPLRAHRRRENIVFLALFARREVAERVGWIRERREPDDRGERGPASHVGTVRTPAARRLVGVAIEIGLTAFELLVVLRPARAQRD